MAVTNDLKQSKAGRKFTEQSHSRKRPAPAEIERLGFENLEAALQKPQEVDSYRLSSLGDALAVVANTMERRAAAEIAKRSAQRVAAALENPQEINSDRLSSLGQRLAAVCRLLPSAQSTHLLAVSNMLVQPVPKEAADGEEQPNYRKLLADVCAQLSREHLAEVLKYPFCTGEAEQIVLGQLEEKT
jgi:hypothetical protein